MSLLVKGRIVQIRTIDAGSALFQAANITDSTLKVENGTDFQEQGGVITLNEENINFLGIQFRQSQSQQYDTLVLSSPLAFGADVGSPVVQYPPTNDRVATVIQMDYDGAPGEAIYAYLSKSTKTQLLDGTYDNNSGPIVWIEKHDYLSRWEVVEAPGTPGQTDAGTIIGTIPNQALAETQMAQDVAYAIALVEDIDDQIEDGLGIRSYRQDDPPTGGPFGAEDLWFDTNNGNKLHGWNGSAWVSIQDAAIAAAAAAAAAAQSGLANIPKVYRQTSMPVDVTLNSIWFDTDDGNKIYVSNGTTYVATPTTIVAGQLAATAIDGMTITGSLFKTSATAGDGSGAQAGVRIGTTGLTAYNAAGATLTISAATGILTAVGAVITGTITATSGSITGILDMGGSGVIRTASSGQRIQISTSGIIGYNSAGVAVTTLSSATGALTATGLNAINAFITGELHAIDPAGTGVKVKPLGDSYGGGGSINFYTLGVAAGSIVSYNNIISFTAGSGGLARLSAGGGNIYADANGVGTDISSGSGQVIFRNSSASATRNDSIELYSSYGGIQIRSAVGKSIFLMGDGASEANSMMTLGLADDRITSRSIYEREYTNAANMYQTSAHTIGRSTSRRRNKVNIQDFELDDPYTLLQARPRTWWDRGAIERAKRDDYDDPELRPVVVGFVAEEFVEDGLEALVTYDGGEPQSIEYDRIIAAAIPLLRDLVARVERLEK